MTQQQQQPQQSAGQGPQANVYATAVDVPEGNRVQVAQVLNQALANATDLQSQAKFAHWNVKGYDFYQLHLLFDEIAETLSEHVDLLAERVTALGVQAMGTTRIAAATSRIPEPPVNAVAEAEYLEWLTDHVARHANDLRADIDRTAELGDLDSSDLLTELSREVDKQLYFLESHLQSAVQTQVPATAEQGSPGTQTGMEQWTDERGQPGGLQRGPGGQARASGQQQPGVQGGVPAQQDATNAPPGTQAQEGTGWDFRSRRSGGQEFGSQPQPTGHPSQQGYRQ